MSRTVRRGIIAVVLLAIVVSALVIFVPDIEGFLAEEPAPTGTPSPTTTSTRTPLPTQTATSTISPTATATLPPHLQCLDRYGHLVGAGLWSEELDGVATSTAGEEAEVDESDITPSPSASGESDPALGPTATSELGSPFSLSPIFMPEVHRWTDEIYRWSGAYGLDPDLVATVMQIESCGNPTLVSSAGAMGLFQVMPFHFFYGEDPFTPETNARRGLPLLQRGLELTLGRTDLTLAVYNGGTGVVLLDPRDWPQETRDYVTWGTGILADIKAGNYLSTSLQVWLAAGGDMLCLQSCLAMVGPSSSSGP